MEKSQIQELAHQWAQELINGTGAFWVHEQSPAEMLVHEEPDVEQSFFAAVGAEIDGNPDSVSLHHLVERQVDELHTRRVAYDLADQILNGDPNVVGPYVLAHYNGAALRMYTMKYAQEIMSSPELYYLYGSASAMDMETVRWHYDRILNDPLVKQADVDMYGDAAETGDVTLEKDIAFEITYGGDRFDSDDVAAAVGPMTRDKMVSFRQRIMDAAIEMNPRQDRDFIERQMDAYLSKVEIEEQVVKTENTEGETADQAWARYSAEGYEVSTAGDRRFSALNARFADGTLLGGVDISGMTIEDVYQHIVKRSGKGLPPATDSVVYNPDLHTDVEKENYSYDNGYLPLWTIWARQNPRLIAELRRKSEGRPLTDKFASTSVTQARALADILRRRGAEFSDEELARYFSGEGRQISADNSLTPERLEGYDVFSVGMGRNSAADFLSMIPSGTDVVVDMRNYNISTYVPQFDRRTLVPSIEANGMQYMWLKDLSGRQWKRAPGSRKGGTERDPLVDYRSYADSSIFREALDDIKALAKSGKKVCIISSSEDAAFDARGLLVGQELERTTNLRIAHIDPRGRDGSLRIRSQEELVQGVIGSRAKIVGGDYLSLHFSSDRSYVTDAGVKVDSGVSAADKGDRLIRGNANYANEGDIQEEPGTPYTASGVASPFRSSMAANAEWADHTVVFSASPSDREANEAVAVAHDYTRISMYGRNGRLSKEDLEDPEMIDRAASKIVDRIGRNLLYRSKARNAMPVENPMALKVNIAGSNQARISNMFVEEAVTEDEISGRSRRVLNRTGLKMDDQTGVSQETVNAFIEAVLRRVGDKVREFGEDEDAAPWAIGHIRTNGQTGVAEGATVAAQSMGLEWSILAARGFTYTIDNETMRGLDVSDEASFKNRFHQGLRHDVSMQNLQEQIETLDRRRIAREDGMQAGLTDRQVLVLHELGFNNSAMIDMIELARDTRVSVNSPADMAEFLDSAAAYGIPGAMGVSEETVATAFASAAEKQRAWKEDGITFVTAASPYYPENLRHFKEDIVNEFITEEREVDGKTELVPVYSMSVIRRPALLWVKGDLSLLDTAALSVVGGVVTNNDTAGMARLLGSGLSQADLPAVVAMSDGVGAEVAREAASRGGRVIGVSGDGIITSDRVSEIDAELAEIESRLPDLTVRAAEAAERSEALLEDLDLYQAQRAALENDPMAADEVAEIDRQIAASREELEGFLAVSGERDALLERRDALYAERMNAEEESRVDPGQRVLQDEVVRNGGLVLSETEPDTRLGEGADRSRAGKLSAALGYGCAIIDAAFSKNTNPMSPVAMAAYALYGVYQIGYKALSSPTPEREGVDGQETPQDERQPRHVIPAGEDLDEMVEEVRAAYENVPEISPESLERAQAVDGPEPEVTEERAEHIPSFFEYFFGGTQAQQQAEAAAENQETAPAAHLRQAPVHVIEYGGDRVYLVPDGQPQIVAALRESFGDGIHVAPLDAEARIMRRLSSAAVVVDGEEVPRFDGYAGTQVRIEEPRTETLYFFRGGVYDLADVPNGAMGLLPQNERRRNAELWSELVNEATALQREFQAAAGVEVDAQVRFENADHLKVNGSSVEVLRGDSVRARIWMDEHGEIRKKNFSIPQDDLQEYHQTPTFSVFPDEDSVIAHEDVTFVIGELRQTLWLRPSLEQRDEMEAGLDREKMDEREEKLRNEFLVPRDDNMDIARKDVSDAREAGLLPMEEFLERADRVSLFAMAQKAVDLDAKKAAKAARDIERRVKKIEALPAVKESDAERLALEEEMDRLVADRQRLFVEMADMEDLKDTLAHGRSVQEMSRKGKTVTLSLDGRPFTMKTSTVTEAERQAAAVSLEDYRRKREIAAEPYKEVKKEQAKSSITFIESPHKDYRSRTVANAQAADVTIAMATDFTTAGEKQTVKAAEGRYVAVEMRPPRIVAGPVEQGRIAAGLVHEALKEKGLLKDGGISINFAGNGLHSLSKAGVTQKHVDAYAVALLSTLVRDYGVKVTSVRSGGQTGMDEAGAKAGVAMGVPTTVLAPAGWKFRDKDGRDISNEAAFKERFGIRMKEILSEGEKTSVAPEKAVMPGEQREARIAELGKWLAEAERNPVMRETTEFISNREEVQRLLEEKKKDAEAAKKPVNHMPQDTKVLFDFDQTNGVCVIGRQDGKMAYADRRMRVISDWYDDLTPMGKTFGIAKRQDGKVKLIDSAGHEVVPRWMDAIGRSVEGMNMVKVDGKYNFLDMKKAELVSPVDFVRATNFHEGFAIVQGGDGKYNFLGTDGKLLCKSGLDSAELFKDGLANVTQNGNAYRLGTDGKVKEVVSQTQDPSQKKGGVTPE